MAKASRCRRWGVEVHLLIVIAAIKICNTLLVVGTFQKTPNVCLSDVLGMREKTKREQMTKTSITAAKLDI